MLKTIKDYLKNNKSYSISLLIMVIISVFIIKLPLINGFTYEFAFIVNIILLLLYPFAFKYIYKLNLYKSSVFLIIPVIIQLFTIKNSCDPFKGVFFYLLIPVTTLFLIYNLLKFIKKHQLKKYYLIILLSLLGELYLLFSEPQIFFYNSFWGYFQGSLYDIDFSISWPLMWLSVFKIINGVILYKINYISSSQKKIIKKEKIIIAFLIISSIVIYLNQSSLGLVSTHQSLQKTLGGHYKTKHFNIYYANTYKIRKKIKLLATEHEMRLSQLEKMYNIRWKTKIDSYIFESGEQKKQLMGAGNTLISKPWLEEIYINYSGSFPQSHLKHELSHIIASKFSNRWLHIPMKFGIIPQMGIVEGFAVSSEDDIGELTLFEKMAILKKINKFPPLEKMVSFEGFWGYNSYFSYQTVGGFLKFLRIKYGVKKLKKLYKKESFKLAYNKNILQLKDEYLSFLDNIEINNKYIPKIKHNFSQKSVFKRVCPHDILEIKEEAQKLMRNRGFEQGIKYGEKLLKLEPDNINHKIYLAQLSIKYKKYKNALSYLNNITTDSESENQSIMKLKADILWLNHNEEKSLKLYKNLIKLNIPRHLYRGIYIKIQALNNENIKNMIENYLLKRKSIGSYLYYFNNIKLDEISENIVNYLYGRYYYNYENYKEAIFYFSRISTTLPYSFNIEILKMQISSYFFMQKYEKSINYTKKLLNISKTQGIKNFSNSWKLYNQYFGSKIKK